MNIRLSAYEMLGISQGSDPQAILSAIDRKMNSNKHSVYSAEMLSAKRELLSSISRFFIDNQEGTSEGYINLEGHHAVAGLVLILEAGGAEECLQLYNQLIRERGNNPVTDSVVQDLELLCDEASLTYSRELKNKRFYESAANVLETRLSSNCRIDRQVASRIDIKKEIKVLAPYRVLDLISRSDERDREKGVALLKQFLNERGGLDVVNSEGMSHDQFCEFFRQIREHLTVQEQIEFYGSESERSKEMATFLEGIALVACGFSQRKPQRIADALVLIRKLNRDELKIIESNILLLLGDVKNSLLLFNQYANDEMKSWASEVSTDNLGGLCIWCEEWLERDVLKGYRDIDVDPDLDAYFSDRDVIAYLEPNYRDADSSYRKHVDEFILDQSSIAGDKHDESGSVVGQNLKRSYNKKKILPAWWQSVGIGGSLIAILGLIIISKNTNYNISSKREVKTAPEIVSSHQTPLNEGKYHGEKGLIYNVISDWLKLKKDALSDLRISENAKKVASNKAINTVLAEVNQLRKSGERKLINVSIQDIKVNSRSDRELIVTATLEYEETILDRNGDVLQKIPRRVFQRKYTLIKGTGGDWVIDS